jgi:DNA-binding GntR family transcriptional regulator
LTRLPHVWYISYMISDRPLTLVESLRGARAELWNAGVLHSTKEEVVYRALKAAIIDGRLMPGTHLVVADVAAAMEASAIPVRDALRRLASEELIELRPHVGAFVTPLPVDYLVEVLEVRHVGEELAVRLAVEHATPEVIARLGSLVDGMEAAVSAEDAHEFATLNRRFHSTIHAAAENRPLLAVLDYLLQRSERGQTIFRLANTRMAESNNEHRQLLEAIRRRDPAAASHVAAMHRQASINVLRQLADRERKG